MYPTKLVPIPLFESDETEKVIHFTLQDAEECCSEAKSPECLDSCKDALFSGLSPKKEHREAVRTHCIKSSPKVFQCVKNHTKLTPTSDLPKCKFIIRVFIYVSNTLQRLFRH